jgi:hypothetical protein
MPQRYTCEYLKAEREWGVYDTLRQELICTVPNTACDSLAPKVKAQRLAQLLNAAAQLVTP